MTGFITTIHIIVCLILIVVVLLQSGKSADLAGAFGGGGSQSVFGPRGAGNILSKVTTVCAILFMITSMGLWMLSAKGAKSVIKGNEPQKKETAAVAETKKEVQKQKAPAGEQKQKKEQNNKEKKKKNTQTRKK